MHTLHSYTRPNADPEMIAKIGGGDIGPGPLPPPLGKFKLLNFF